MRAGGGASAPEHIGAGALREWITGERGVYSRVFLVESGAGASGIDDVTGAGDVILLPADSAPFRGLATVVHFTGAFSEIGDELFFGDRGVELQDYVAAAFVQVVGPTVVCLHDELSWQAFLDDAELARRTGVFPSALIDPRVLLADRAALENPGALATPRAIRVASDGRVSTGVRGEIIGDVADLQDLLSVPLAGVVSLSRLVPSRTLAERLADREWIGRYLHATDLVKMLRLENGAADISGFGRPLLDDDGADAEPLAADPFLVDTADGVLLADTKTLRRQLLSPVTAVVVAVTQTSSGLEIAAGRLERLLGLTASDASTLCREALTTLNVHFGMHVDRAHRTTGAAR